MILPSGGAGWRMLKPAFASDFTSTMPVIPFWRRSACGFFWFSTACAASVACPTNGASLRGVKNLTPVVVVRRSGGEHECGVAIVEFARNGLHFGRGQLLGIQHHAGRIAAEARVGKCIDLEDADKAWHVQQL